MLSFARGSGRSIPVVGRLALPLLVLAPLSANASGFLENLGQVDPAVHSYAPGETFSLGITPTALIVDLRRPTTDRGCVVRLEFVNANPEPRLELRRPTAERFHFFLGNEPAAWRRDVRSYEEVILRGLWPGLDLAVREEDGRLVTELIAAPGADTERARFRTVGADRVTETESGVDLVETEAGSFRHVRPTVGRLRGGFAGSTDPFDRVPPTDVPAVARDYPSRLVWSTYLNGSEGERDVGADVALDSSGRPVVIGATRSPSFPVTSGGYDTSLLVSDAFVTKLEADGGNLVWGTFLGGSGIETGDGLEIGTAGDLVLLGSTQSEDFPIPGTAYQASRNGSADLFVAGLSDDGSDLLWATYLGSGVADDGNDLALDPADQPIVVGWTTGSDFPTTSGAYDESYNPGGLGGDGFIAKLTSDGSGLVWGTYLGGDAGRDECTSVVLDAFANPVVVGYTQGNFPTTGSVYQATYQGGYADGFVTKVAATGGSLVWSTYLGGSENDLAVGVDLDGLGNPLVTGSTLSLDFPVSFGAYDSHYSGGLGDAFVTKLDPAGANLLAGTYLGGLEVDFGYVVAVDSLGAVTVAGHTQSDDFPVTLDGYDTSANGENDVFVAQMDPTLGTLAWGTYLGGSDEDLVSRGALEFGATRSLVITGPTWSADFPTTSGAYDPTYDPGDNPRDAFVSKVLLPEPEATCAVAPTTLQFGATLVGSSEDQGFTITNAGSGTLNGVVSASCGAFDVTIGAGSYSLGPGQSHAVTVRFEPMVAGEHTCTILTGNASCSDVFCAGQAFEEDGCQPAPPPATGMDFGTTAVGGYEDDNFVLAFVGTGSISGHVSLDDPGGSYLILSGGGSFTLGAGEFRVVTIRFAPITVGIHAGTILTGDPGCGDVPMTGAGEEITGLGAGPAASVATLRQNRPNPFRFGLTAIGYVLPRPARASLSVYSVSGRLVVTLLDEVRPAGPGRVFWNGRDRQGRPAVGGTYFYRLIAGDFVETKRLVLIR